MARRRERGWAASVRVACGREGMRACTQRRVHGAHVVRFAGRPEKTDPIVVPCKIASSAFSNFVRFLCNDHTFVASMWCATFEVKTTTTSSPTNVFSFFFSGGSKIHLSTSSRGREMRVTVSQQELRALPSCSRTWGGAGETLTETETSPPTPPEPTTTATTPCAAPRDSTHTHAPCRARLDVRLRLSSGAEPRAPRGPPQGDPLLRRPPAARARGLSAAAAAAPPLPHIHG